MDANHPLRRLPRTLARGALYSATFLITHLPFAVVRAVLRVLIAIGFLFTVKQKRIARESLQIAFGQEKDQQEIDTIFKKCFENVGKSMVELIYYIAHPSMIDEKVVLKNEDKERLDRALKNGKGVIAVSAHFGNFPLMLLSLVRAGYPTTAIIRRARDEKAEKYFQKLRSQVGLRAIYAQPRIACAHDSLKVLRNNEFLFIPLDQNFGSGRGVFVDFFGQKAATATGPVVFATRTGAPIVPMFIVRQEDDTHQIMVDDPIYLKQGADEEETIFINVSRITQVIESYIRRYPHEWGWMHRRWKTRPGKTETVK